MRRDLIIKRRKRRNKIIAVTTAAIIAVTGSVYTCSFAADRKEKEQGFSNTETVYVLTDNKGKETDRIVSERGNLHYKGYENETLPVDVSVKYTLDGKEINPDKLAGKNGSLKIQIKYNTNSINGTSIPFVAVSGLVTNSSNFSNVSIDNGKVIEDGNRTIIMAFGMPGVEENLHCSDIISFPDTVNISGEAHNFNVDGMYTFMTKEIFEEADFNDKFNTEALTGKMDEMTGGVKQLRDGADKLDQGIGALGTGADQLREGTSQLKKGASDLNNGFGTLNNGSKELDENTKKLAGAAEQLSNGSQKISQATGQLNNGLKTLVSQNDALNAGAAQLVAGAFNTASKEITAAIQPVAPGTVITLTEENYVQTIDNLIAMAKPMESKLNAVKAQLAGAVEFRNGLAQYTGGALQAATGAEDLDNNIKTQFNPGMIQLKEGTSMLANGQTQFATGLYQAGKGAEQLKDGTSMLYAKENDFINGIKQLKAGSEQLKEGTVILDDKINEELNKIKGSNYIATLKRTADLRASAKNYKSFGNKSDYESVTFIYKTKGIMEAEKK